jgi:predicted anti-sigma-YlaC factor YlaD
MTECDKFRTNFSNYLDGELHLERRKLLEDHFSVCPECHDTYRQMKNIQQNLNNLPQISTSVGFEQNLQQSILRQNQNPGFIPPQLQNWKLPAMGSAIVVATVSLFLVFNNSSAPDSGDTDNQVNTALPQIPVNASRQMDAPESSTSSTYESSTLISDSDSLASDSLRLQREKIQQVKGK